MQPRIPPAFTAAHAELTALLVLALRDPDGLRRCEAAQAADKTLARLWHVIEQQHADGIGITREEARP